jgi:hypothetical protein
MKLRYLCGIALLSMIGCQPRPDLAEEALAIRELWEAGGKALENRDFDAYSNFWANNERVQIMHPDVPEWLVGWSTLGPRYQERMAGGPDLRARTYDWAITVSPSAEMAWATMKVEVQVITSDTVTFVAWESAVFEKLDGSWRLVQVHMSTPAS